MLHLILIKSRDQQRLLTVASPTTEKLVYRWHFVHQWFMYSHHLADSTGPLRAVGGPGRVAPKWWTPATLSLFTTYLIHLLNTDSLRIHHPKQF